MIINWREGGTAAAGEKSSAAKPPIPPVAAIHSGGRSPRAVPVIDEPRARGNAPGPGSAGRGSAARMGT